MVAKHGKLHRQFCRNLRQLRTLRGWSSEALGRRVGVLGSQIRSYEAGRRVPTLATVERYAKALRVPPEKLLHNGRQTVDKSSRGR